MKRLAAAALALLMMCGVAIAQADDDSIDAPDGGSQPVVQTPDGCDALRAGLGPVSTRLAEAGREVAAMCFARAQRARTQGGGEIAATLITVAGEVVIDRATSVAWGLLSKKLKSAAGCSDDKDDRMPATCQVLEDVKLQDLIASPQVLLDAAVEDLVVQIGDRLTKAMPCKAIGSVEVCPGAMLEAALKAWREGGEEALAESLRAQLVALSIDALGASVTDDTVPAPLRGAALFSRCAIDINQLRPLSDCRFLSDLTPQQRADLLPYAAVVDAAVRVRKPSAVIEAAIALVHTLHPDKKEVLVGLENMVRGLLEKDWSRAAAGAIAVIRYYVAQHDQQKKSSFSDDSKVFRLLASVGQYAATYVDKGLTPEGAHEARRKAIESLIDSMTDRSQRENGVVLSIGGQFGVGYAQRHTSDEEADGTPFHLAFGVGVDHFCGKSWGIHGMLTLVDASSYVAFSDKKFAVVDPDAKAALAMGGTLGVWFAEPQTPLFIGANVTYSPFVDIDPDDGESRGSYQVMGLVGVYVPFIDFN